MGSDRRLASAASLLLWPDRPSSTGAQMTTRSNLVQQLWSLCNILRDDGITYHQYVNELTYLLFLKMAKELGVERDLPSGYRWDDLTSRSGTEQFDFYRDQLVKLGTLRDWTVREIFANPTSLLRHSHSLNILVLRIDGLDWYRARQEGLGDLYEGLLQKNATEKKGGAGQYFTPRPLIDTMVAVMRPTLRDVIQDPAAGTGGFLVAADRHIRENADTSSWKTAEWQKYRRATFYGMEHVQDTYRLALMNLMLHGIESTPEGSGVRLGDTLSSAGQSLPSATLMLTNPPFGTKSGGGQPTRSDFAFPTSNKQLCFLQHIYGGLKPGGRAAVVLPDSVLFEGGTGRQVRVDLMEKCNLHTILRLPTGIFYAHGVKTNVLFFTRGKTNTGNTKAVWVYDLRSDMPQFGKRTPLTRSHFTDFEAAFGPDPVGTYESLRLRTDTGEHGRFRRFQRDWIAAHSDNLDISWLPSASEWDVEETSTPAELAVAAISELEAAINDLRAILEELGEEIDQ